MRYRTFCLAFFATALFSCGTLNAQCTPDPACEDTGDPGQFCPDKLPKAGINVLYDEVVTVIAPGTYVIYEQEISILHIQIDSVKNLPPGISYFPNAEIFYPDTAYCIQLTGTPTQVGEYPLSIYISATANVMGTPTPVPVMDTTSVIITVVEVLGIDPKQTSAFQVSQNAPNPFSDLTRLAYYTPAQDLIELRVYNMLGVLVYEESNRVQPGAHYFGFDGARLKPGTYFYRAENSDTYLTGKLIKSR